MRIGIDARFYGTLGKGLGRYVSELIARLERLDDGNEYVIFLRNGNFDDYVPSNPRFAKVRAEFPWYGWREQLIYPLWLRRFRIDLMHFPHFNVPFFYRRPFVVTIHDLILLSHPTPRASTLGPLLYRIKYAAYRLIIAHAMRASQAVITVSESSRNEIRKRFSFMHGREIAVTYEAVTPAVESTVPAPRAEAVTAPFLLYVGNAYPHKNLDALLAAFADFRKRGFADRTLVLVGSQDYFYDRLHRDAIKLGMADGVKFFGRATDAELATLYRRAEAYVFPSLCEGFGLPPLEAMSNGLPVASSKAAAMPEILGDAALYFDPSDQTSIVDALVNIVTDNALRTELIRKGLSRAAEFDWDDCARQTMEVYRRAVR
jgi:glycosyltransferase involved in cell wall biosynthesis